MDVGYYAQIDELLSRIEVVKSRTVSSKSGNMSGFCIQRLPGNADKGPPTYPEMNKIGSAGRRRWMDAANSWPDMPGIMTSVMTRFTRRCCSRSRIERAHAPEHGIQNRDAALFQIDLHHFPNGGIVIH